MGCMGFLAGFVVLAVSGLEFKVLPVVFTIRLLRI